MANGERCLSYDISVVFLLSFPSVYVKTFDIAFPLLSILPYQHTSHEFFPLVQQLSTKIGGRHAQVDSKHGIVYTTAHHLFPCLAIGPFLLRSSCAVLVHL